MCRTISRGPKCRQEVEKSTIVGFNVNLAYCACPIINGQHKKIEDYFVSSNLYFRTLGKNLCLLIDFQFEWSGCVIFTFDRRILKTSKLLRFSKNFTNTKFLLNCYDIWMGWWSGSSLISLSYFIEILRN